MVMEQATYQAGDQTQQVVAMQNREATPPVY